MSMLHSRGRASAYATTVGAWADSLLLAAPTPCGGTRPNFVLLDRPSAGGELSARVPPLGGLGPINTHGGPEARPRQNVMSRSELSVTGRVDWYVSMSV
jgi:hypothetical protein